MKKQNGASRKNFISDNLEPFAVQTVVSGGVHAWYQAYHTGYGFGDPNGNSLINATLQPEWPKANPISIFPYTIFRSHVRSIQN